MDDVSDADKALERLSQLKLSDRDMITGAAIAKVLNRNPSRVRVYFKQGRIKGRLNKERGLRGVLEATVEEVRRFIETDFAYTQAGRVVGQEAGVRRFRVRENEKRGN